MNKLNLHPAVFLLMLVSTVNAVAQENTQMHVARQPGAGLLYYLNVYPEDVLRGTRGQPHYDPIYEEALAYGARVLSHKTNTQPKKGNQP